MHTGNYIAAIVSSQFVVQCELPSYFSVRPVHPSGPRDADARARKAVEEEPLWLRGHRGGAAAHRHHVAQGQFMVLLNNGWLDSGWTDLGHKIQPLSNICLYSVQGLSNGENCTGSVQSLSN